MITLLQTLQKAYNLTSEIYYDISNRFDDEHFDTFGEKLGGKICIIDNILMDYYMYYSNEPEDIDSLDIDAPLLSQYQDQEEELKWRFLYEFYLIIYFMFQNKDLILNYYAWKLLDSFWKIYMYVYKDSIEEVEEYINDDNFFDYYCIQKGDDLLFIFDNSRNYPYLVGFLKFKEILTKTIYE